MIPVNCLCYFLYWSFTTNIYLASFVDVILPVVILQASKGFTRNYILAAARHFKWFLSKWLIGIYTHINIFLWNLFVYSLMLVFMYITRNIREDLYCIALHCITLRAAHVTRVFHKRAAHVTLYCKTSRLHWKWTRYFHSHTSTRTDTLACDLYNYKKKPPWENFSLSMRLKVFSTLQVVISLVSCSFSIVLLHRPSTLFPALLRCGPSYHGVSLPAVV